MNRTGFTHRQSGAISRANAGASLGHVSRNPSLSWPTPGQTVFEMGSVLVAHLACALTVVLALAALGIC